jgi:copper chaperone CopZ
MRYTIFTHTGGVWVKLESENTGYTLITETPHDQNTTVQQDAIESRATLALEGMTCASCAMRIAKGLKKVAGVKDANVNLATEQAVVTYDPAQTNLEQMAQKVEAVGYMATPRVATLQQPGVNPSLHNCWKSVAAVHLSWDSTHKSCSLMCA